MTSDAFRRVGWALIVVGVLDIGYMVYCIVNHLSYGSSFNIFAVIAGSFLLRRNLRAAKVVTWFAALLLTGLGGVLILLPLVIPLDFWAVQLRLNPVSTPVTLAVAIAALVFVSWVYRELTSEAVVEARRSAGLDTKRPFSAFVAGVAVVTIFMAMALAMNHSSSADVARQKAQQQLGGNYKYYVSSMEWSGSGGRATVTAYNDAEVKEVQVEW